MTLDQLVDLLLATGIVDVVNALFTAVLALFAGVQLAQVRSQRRAELREAHGAVWVEFWRMWTLTTDWEREGLRKLAEDGRLYPDEILPPDWSTLLPLLGRLGPMPARLAGSAYALARNAASHARGVVAMAAEYREERRTGRPGAEHAVKLMDLQGRIELAERVALHQAKQASNLMEAALQHVPQWLLRLEIIRVPTNSPFAAQVHEKLESKLAESAIYRFRRGIRLWMTSRWNRIRGRGADTA